MTILGMEEERQLDWMSMAPYWRRQAALQDKRTDDTGIWFLDSEEYNHWKANPGDILWLSGISKSFDVPLRFPHIANYRQQWAVANLFFGMAFFLLQEENPNLR